METTLRLTDLLTIVAVLLGPILAVQAQKWIERKDQRSAVKNQIFTSLMATRATRLSERHVQALNMIDIAFYGRNVGGERKQSKVEKNVTRAWHEYFSTLEEAVGADASQDQHDRLHQRRDEKFNELLVAIAVAQGYDFEALELRKRRYNPEAHFNLETQALAIRCGVEAVLTGRQSIKMELTNLPPAQGDTK